MTRPESPKEIESKVREFLRVYAKGVDIVLAMGYTVGCEHTVILNSGDPANCRKLCRTLWASLQNERSTVQSPTSSEPEED